MKKRIVEQGLNELAAAPGVRGCALVDSGSGLVLHAVGTWPGEQPIWEAAIDYWRLHQRMNVHFVGLGDLGAAVMYHVGGVLAILPCSVAQELLVVCVAEHRSVDWKRWQNSVRAMGENLRQIS